eukprot:13599435-Alexandrium_andersonii.AAC.1
MCCAARLRHAMRGCGSSECGRGCVSRTASCIASLFTRRRVPGHASPSWIGGAVPRNTACVQ